MPSSILRDCDDDDAANGEGARSRRVVGTIGLVGSFFLRQRTELTATHKACLEICELMGASSGSTLMSFATKKVHGLEG